MKDLEKPDNQEIIEMYRVPRLEEQMEAYLYLEKHPSKSLLYGLKKLGLADSSNIKTYLNCLETGETQLFLGNVKEDLCYKIAEDLFPAPAKHSIDFYNSYQKIGEAVLNYYKSLKKSLKKPEAVTQKDLLLKKLGISFPMLTTKRNEHLGKKTSEILTRYDNKLKSIVQQRKSLTGIVQDLRGVKDYEFLKDSFNVRNKLTKTKVSYLLKVLEKAVINSRHEEDFSFIDSIHFDLALEYQSLGKYGEMLKQLKSITSEDLLPYAYWITAKTYEGLRNYGKAVNYWKKLSEIIPKDFEIIHNKTNEVGYVKSPLLRNIIFKQNTKKEKPKAEFENTNFIFNKVKDRNFNVPIPIAYIENPEEKSYALFKEVKPFIGKTLTLLEELEHCKKELAKVSRTVKKEHPWFDKGKVFKEYKHLMIKNVIGQIIDMQTGIKPEKIRKHVPEIKDYNYEKTLEEKLVKRVDKPELLEHSKPIISYLERQDKVFGHCDLNETNILDLGYGELCFIDFENSALVPKLFDLAYFLERPSFNLDEKERKEMIDYFVSKLEEKGVKVEKPYKSYLYNAAFVSMRIIGGCLGWTERTGKKYTKKISFYRKNAIKAIDQIVGQYANKKDSETLLNLKKSLEG